MSATELLKYQLPIENIVTRYASIDIETDGIDPSESQTVAIGIGLYDELNEEQSIDVLTYGGALGCERTLIRRAFERINEFEPSALVTFNGMDFDLDYLQGRITRLPFDGEPELSCTNHHIDLFRPRKRRASEVGEKWPSLEETLEAHGIVVEPTEWQGEELTNTIFGESLAPTYLQAVESGSQDRVQEMDRVIHKYTATDVAANISLYEADAGRR
ncbi:ribonuclease H-like domain-containing protein [Halomicroarcula sp. GCM10025709]|uniref:ribonuclease H-like domain-containing protein n=1 Tax=Halomicroarcula sp. GCM10025709 TaxID=3252669 RepID=UPI0036102573